MTHYPGYDALSRWSTVDWDDSTRAVVRARCENVPSFRFFDPDQAQLLDAVVQRIVPQPERDASREFMPRTSSGVRATTRGWTDWTGNWLCWDR